MQRSICRAASDPLVDPVAPKRPVPSEKVMQPKPKTDSSSPLLPRNLLSISCTPLWVVQGCLFSAFFSYQGRAYEKDAGNADVF
jgi:hypothetical protein